MNIFPLEKSCLFCLSYTPFVMAFCSFECFPFWFQVRTMVLIASVSSHWHLLLFHGIRDQIQQIFCAILMNRDVVDKNNLGAICLISGRQPAAVKNIIYSRI